MFSQSVRVAEELGQKPKSACISVYPRNGHHCTGGNLIFVMIAKRSIFLFPVL